MTTRTLTKWAAIATIIGVPIAIWGILSSRKPPSIEAENSNVVVGNFAPVRQTLIVNPKESISSPILKYKVWIPSYEDKGKYVTNFFVVILFSVGDRMDGAVQTSLHDIACEYMSGGDYEGNGSMKYVNVDQESRVSVLRFVQCISTKPIVDNGGLFIYKQK